MNKSCYVLPQYDLRIPRPHGYKCYSYYALCFVIYELLPKMIYYQSKTIKGCRFFVFYNVYRDFLLFKTNRLFLRFFSVFADRAAVPVDNPTVRSATSKEKTIARSAIKKEKEVKRSMNNV